MQLRKYFFSNDTLLLITGTALICGAGIINFSLKKPELKLSKQDTAININKDLLVFMSAGNKRLITDLLWVQTLIESDLEHYKGRDLNSWLFLRFNTISVLDPHFYENYLYGGQFLAIVKDDLEGAETIYVKGLEYYPNDYKLNFNAGFLFYFEKGNLSSGLNYLKRIQSHPSAPPYMTSIINKLEASTGVNLEVIFNLVLHHFNATQEPTLKARLKKDLYAIRSEIDLTCLNSKKVNCRIQDLDGIPYIKKDNKYTTAKEFRPYQIKTRKDLKESN